MLDVHPLISSEVSSRWQGCSSASPRSLSQNPLGSPVRGVKNCYDGVFSPVKATITQTLWLIQSDCRLTCSLTLERSGQLKNRMSGFIPVLLYVHSTTTRGLSQSLE